MRNVRRPERGFTLIELLVVIAILATLIGILLPSLSAARKRGMLLKCMSNMRQIAIAVQMYAQENDGFFPRTMEPDGSEPPATISWWAVHNYQLALEPYVGENGVSTGKGNNVWFEPGDPEANVPAMWGSFVENGLITGVPRRESNIYQPSATIFATLRETPWSEAVGVSVPEPLPVSDRDDPFWSSVYFDMCLDPWAPTGDETHEVHWSKGRVTPPESLFPGAADAGVWDEVIDGRSAASGERKPRYPGGEPYSFCDGHVESMRFEATYQGPDANLWDLR
jgi:prepilin-type N-terminal cleavage/methylation domain-containing protein